MPVPSVITDLDPDPNDNFPIGSENVFPELDNYLRAHAAFIRQNYDNKASLADLADTTNPPNGAGLVGVAKDSPAEESQTVFSILRERRSFWRYLTAAEQANVIERTGTLDLSVKLQACKDGLLSSGGVILLPDGIIGLGSAVNLDTEAVVMEGHGDATVLRALGASHNILNISSERIELHGLRFDSATTRTGGWYVDVLSGGNRFKLQRFSASGAHGFMRTAAAATVTVEDGRVLDGIGGTGIVFRVLAGFDVSIRDIVADQGTNLFAGVLVDECGDLTIEDCNFIRCGTPLLAEITTGKVLASLWVNNTFFDTSSSRGAYLYANGGSIVRSIFDQVWFSGHASEGIRLQTASGGSVNGTYFDTCHFYLNAGNGATIADSGVVNTHFIGGAASGNGGAGLLFDSNVSVFSVTGMRIGAADGLGANNNGIVIGAGSGNNFRIIGNDLRSNTAGALSNGATGTTVRVANNLGVGADTAGIVVGASPFTYTAGASHETVYIDGGTVSLVTVDGANVFLSTNKTIRLAPRKSVTVTYSVAPGMARTVD